LIPDFPAQLTVPASGRNVSEEALVNVDGVEYVPPSPSPKLVFAVAAAVTGMAALLLLRKYGRRLLA